MKKQIRQSMAIMLSFLVAFSALAIPPVAVAGVEVHNASLASDSFTIITTAGQLNEVRNNPSGHFILANDIDL